MPAQNIFNLPAFDRAAAKDIPELFIAFRARDGRQLEAHRERCAGRSALAPELAN